MKNSVVGVFDRYESARNAAGLLAAGGFDPGVVHVTPSSLSPAESMESGASAGLGEAFRSLIAEVFGPDKRPEIADYNEAVRRGGALVKVDVDDPPRIEEARRILAAAGAVNLAH